jgi:3-oxoacyl-(acyl-carrier-protein) synthase
MWPGRKNTDRLKTYLHSSALLSPLGMSTKENFHALVSGRSGIRKQVLSGFPEPFWGARMDDSCFEHPELAPYTKFEKMLIMAAKQAIFLAQIDPASSQVLFIIATTKGNIDLIDPEQSFDLPQERLYLWKSAEVLTRFFQNPNPAIVVSQACISGVSAVLTARAFLQNTAYTQAVVVGADTLSRFTYAGFSGLKALAPGPCKPFDRDREGLNLGEAAAALVLGNTPPDAPSHICIAAGTASNDAHHLSAPSRSGEGLYRAMKACLKDFGRIPDFLNVHGTATLFNDEMESIALARVGLQQQPLTAFKGYFGHTLGAAGLVDLVVSARCMEEGLLLPVLGYTHLGVSEPLRVQTRPEQKALQSCLKTASGFGGSNAVIILERVAYD